VGTVVASALAVPLLTRGRPADTRAGHNLGELISLGDFRFTERSGKEVTQADLADRVWIADFVFTRCPSSCPLITKAMSGLQERLRRTGVRMVSFTVDPDHDTPAALSTYARRFGAQPERWWFLTGAKAGLYDFIVKRFRVGVTGSTPEEQKEGAEAISHSGKFVLVDRGNRVAGYYDSSDPDDVALLEARARQLDLNWPPVLNATLNASAAILLLLGWFLIRAGRIRGHATCMVTALVVSLLFLTSYLFYHYKVGSVAFRGIGAPRLVYFTILLSHTVLAITAVPLIAMVLVRALRYRFAAHARLARVTFPIWLYVSVTGVVIYVMLYQMEFPTSFG
jgi:protein SCO1/2/putative membrane protein